MPPNTSEYTHKDLQNTYRGTSLIRNRMQPGPGWASGSARTAERELCIDNLLVRIHFIIVMIRWTGLAPWEFEFPFPGSLASTFLKGSLTCTFLTRYWRVEWICVDCGYIYGSLVFGVWGVGAPFCAKINFALLDPEQNINRRILKYTS